MTLQPHWQLSQEITNKRVWNEWMRYKGWHAGRSPEYSKSPLVLLNIFEMSDNYSTRTVSNHHVAEMRSQGTHGDNMLPTSMYIKDRVNELKQNAEERVSS